MFILFGGALAGLVTLRHLAVKERRIENVILAALNLCIGACAVYAGLSFSNSLFGYPFIILTIVPILYFIGPLLYIYFSKIIQQDVKLQVVHFIPGVAVALLLFPFYLNDSVCKIEFLQNKSSCGFLSFEMYQVLIAAAVVSMLLYLAPLMKTIIKILVNGTSGNAGLITATFIVISITVTSFSVGLIGIFISDRLMQVGFVITTVAYCAAFVFGARYPDYSLKISEEVKKSKYVFSRIRDLDIDSVLNHLYRLMEHDKIYTDNNIKLIDVADELSINPHQLSEILNNKLNKSFKAFINEYRVHEACALLKKEPGKAIIRIGLEAGFVSKSSFNAAFHKIMGCTPTEFREKI